MIEVMFTCWVWYLCNLVNELWKTNVRPGIQSCLEQRKWFHSSLFLCWWVKQYKLYFLSVVSYLRTVNSQITAKFQWNAFTYPIVCTTSYKQSTIRLFLVSTKVLHKWIRAADNFDIRQFSRLLCLQSKKLFE